MKIYKDCVKVFAFLYFFMLPVLALAVTDKEMEQARTIAAKSYLRYANDGSGYLDEINPTTMAELEAALKTKEKENIKAFKAIPVPENYKDWDKEKLVEYWAVTAFQDKGILEKGRGGRIRARSLINKMTITPPAQVKEPVNEPAEVAKPANDGNKTQTTDASVDSMAQVAPAESLPDMPDDLVNVEPEEKAANYTWVYIMVLAILVAVVIALVVYAANVMKKNGARHQAPYGGSQEGDISEIKEHYEGLIADKDVEIAMLNKKLETASRQNSEYRSKLEAMSAELAALKSVSHSRTHSEGSKPEEAAPKKSTIRSIYLGRANSRGIFVRADRTLNPGHSIFKLDTSDGYTGTFRVADSPAVWQTAMSNPAEYLETACNGEDLEDTRGYNRIVTETSGTAVFEGGCWRVSRKARIRYV
ncbi:MAG: hypothetical protein J1F16_07870 [Muribaculaceae bacterium]|nr:hypothetical protein [Muribaculaceae bacterium]